MHLQAWLLLLRHQIQVKQARSTHARLQISARLQDSMCGLQVSERLLQSSMQVWMRLQVSAWWPEAVAT